MRRSILHHGLLIGLLVLSLIRGVYAGPTDHPPVSYGIVLTIVALDPKRHTATLQADDGGQVFQLTAATSWKIGHKVECDLVDIQPGPRLQHCQPWS
jgi:hypothetical protein